MTINIDNIIENIYNTVKSHRIEEGKYARWLWQSERGNRQLGINEYGCADAANILYTIGKFPSIVEDREAWISALQDLQDPTTGLFVEATHHPIHTTAHCIAALELFDAKPKYPLTDLMQYSTKEGLYGLLEGLDWLGNPWPQSHQGAGIYAAMVLADAVDTKWEDDYFDWFWENADPISGMWKKGSVQEGESPAYKVMAAAFHYLFNHEYAHRPLRYPEKFVDSLLDMYNKKEIGSRFGEGIGFIDVDWVYCVNRATRQTSYRYDECKKVLAEFAVTITDFLNSIDAKTHDGFNDLHMLFGTTCCLAELQQALPGMIRSTKPLKLVLDRRPFI